MASGSPSFVVTLPLKTTPADERACGIALDAARQIYNAVLGEALRRLDRMRQSKEFAAARQMPKGAPSSKERKARAAEFNRLRETFDLTPGSLQRFAQSCRDQCWIGDHLPGHCCQTAATRAFKTIEAYAFGIRRRPKFRRKDNFNSIEGKEPKSTIIWRDGAVRFAGMVLPAIIDPENAWAKSKR